MYTHREKERVRHTCCWLSLWMVDLYVHRVIQSSMDGVDRVVDVKSVDAVDALRVPVCPEYLVLEQRYSEWVRQIYKHTHTHTHHFNIHLYRTVRCICNAYACIVRHNILRLSLLHACIVWKLVVALLSCLLYIEMQLSLLLCYFSN